MSKTLDKAAVKTAAEKLMKDNGSTTTLDVKNALRKDGYFAEQRTVSDYMTTLSSEEQWDYTSNGSFNTYAIPDPTAVVVTQTNSVTPPAANTSKVDAIIAIIEDMFKIHKFAMSASSRIGIDLDLDPLQIEDLLLECEGMFDVDMPSVLRSATTTIQDIQDVIDRDAAIPAAQKIGRVKIDIEPTRLFGHPTSHCGATDSEIKDLLDQKIISENDWILSLGGSSTRMIYSGNDSRDHVRTAFARKIGSRIQATRARRVKSL